MRREYFRLAEFRTDQVAQQFAHVWAWHGVGRHWYGGNPGGRPKRKPITEALEKVFTPEQCLAVAQALLKQAKKGSISHVQEAANRLEGKVESSDESAGGVTFNVIISAPRPHRPAIGDGSRHEERDRR